MTKNDFTRYFRSEILPQIIEQEQETGTRDYPGRRQAWNDTIDSMIKDGTLPDRAGDWIKPKDIEGNPTTPPKRAQAANIGTSESPVRYTHLDRKAPDYRAKYNAQWDQAERDVKAGKAICLSDLMISAGM